MDAPRDINSYFMHMQARTQPFSKRGYMGGVAQIGMMWALAHSPHRGVWGHAPSENFGNLDSLRAILRDSDST